MEKLKYPREMKLDKIFPTVCIFIGLGLICYEVESLMPLAVGLIALGSVIIINKIM